jgi:hypothetical protein
MLIGVRPDGGGGGVIVSLKTWCAGGGAWLLTSAGTCVMGRDEKSIEMKTWTKGVYVRGRCKMQHCPQDSTRLWDADCCFP